MPSQDARPQPDTVNISLAFHRAHRSATHARACRAFVLSLDGSGETVASPSALLQRVMALNAATLCASGKANGWDGVCYDGRPLAEVRRA